MTNNSSFYNFSAEEDGEDDILNRAFDRWEWQQMGGGADDEQDTNQILNSAYDRWEQYGGGGTGPLFKFKLVAIGKRRTWRDVVQRETFNAELIQLREPVKGDNIGLALTESLYNGIENELNRQQRPAHHFVNMAITANNFNHGYQTINFSVGEFLNRSTRLDEMLQKLAGKLNSNESFHPSQGFQVDVVFVRMLGKGKGRQKNNAGQRCLDKANKNKKCIITIKNTDALCCARAIITMRTHCHRHEGVEGNRNWENLKRGLPVQEEEAKELHRKANAKQS